MCDGQYLTPADRDHAKRMQGGEPKPLNITPHLDGLYKHYRRGHIFRVVCVALDDDAKVFYVVLQGVHDERYWTRTLANFNGQTGEGAVRFAYIGQYKPS